MKTAIRLSFSKPQLVYAIVMAISMCLIMSAVTTSILVGKEQFWHRWPTVLSMDLMVAIPAAILLGPLVRYLINRLYPQL